MKAYAILAALTLFTLAVTQNIPIWPARFQQDFVESYSSSQYHDVGKLWFDAERGMSRLDRNNGKNDRMCASVLNATTPCIHLVRDSKRYLVFPLVKSCCYCCDSS
jgi:hypothetical protein